MLLIWRMHRKLHTIQPSSDSTQKKTPNTNTRSACTHSTPPICSWPASCQSWASRTSHTAAPAAAAARSGPGTLCNTVDAKICQKGGGLRRITILTNFFTSHKVGLFAEQNAPKGSKINSFGNEGIGRTARSCGRGPVPTNRNDNLFLPNSNSLLKLKTQLTYITSTCIWFPKF